MTSFAISYQIHNGKIAFIKTVSKKLNNIIRWDGTIKKRKKNRHNRIVKKESTSNRFKVTENNLCANGLGNNIGEDQF